MTTDPFPKETAVEVSSTHGTFRVGGVAKGSGMIEPLMATMLGFVTTDTSVEPAVLQRALKEVADDTFNAITVDGECSTNDCVFVLANGESGVRLGEAEYPLLVAALRAVCEPLAIGIVRGGEGATKLITVRVRRGVGRGRSPPPRAIANSPLVKTPCTAGSNWGRLIAVAGRSGGLRLRRSFGSVRSLFAPATPRPRRRRPLLKQRDRPRSRFGTGGRVVADVDVRPERGYVRINADYRT
jgi:glutamate N-acetyltransferase/amino-acid N-acetyltransferase